MNKLAVIALLSVAIAVAAFTPKLSAKPQSLLVQSCTDGFCKVGCKNASVIPLHHCQQGEEIACHIDNDGKGRHCVNLTRYAETDTTCTTPIAASTAVCGYCYNNSGTFGHLIGCEKSKDHIEFEYSCNSTCGECTKKVSLATCAVSPFDMLPYTVNTVGPCAEIITFRNFKDSDCSGGLDNFTLLSSGCDGSRGGSGSSFYSCV